MTNKKEYKATEWDSLIKACILIETTLNDKLRQVSKDRLYYEEMRLRELNKNE